MIVGIVAANKLKYSPYVFYYVNILKELNLEYEIIVPKRNKSVEDICVKNTHEFTWEDEKSSIINYIRYCRDVKKYSIKKFDFMIILTTNIAVFSNGWLRKYFNNKYIVDIRDYTYENNRLFYMLEKRAVCHAALRVISSKKFQVFLPQSEYLVCHNNTWPDERKDSLSNCNRKRIVIGYVGAVAYKEQCIRLMNLVQADARFEFHIYGDGVAQKELKKYAEEMKCDRIKFFGRYVPEEKKHIINKIDILFNAYGNGSPLVDYALSNKLYDALYFGKPVLNSPNTYMSEMCGPLSYEIDFENVDSLDELSKWYDNMEKNVMEEYSRKQYSNIIEEDKITKNKIKHTLINIKENS